MICLRHNSTRSGTVARFLLKNYCSLKPTNIAEWVTPASISQIH